MSQLISNDDSNLRTTDEVSLNDFFIRRAGKASLRIYTNLASDPFIEGLAHRKQLNYREMLILVSSVVGALDEKIEELELRQRPLKQISTFINSPLISPSPSVNGSQAEPSVSDSASQEENKWLLKYLTLRNAGGFLITSLTLAAGFFAWLNSDYRSLISAAQERAEVASKENLDLKEVIRTLESNALELQTNFAVSEAKLGAAEDAIKDLENKLTEEQSKLASTEAKTANVLDQAVSSVSQANAALEELSQLKTENTRLSSNLKKAESELQSERSRGKSYSEALNKRSSDFSDLEKTISDLTLERESAVSSWNQLLSFIEKNKSGGQNSTVEFKARELTNQLEELENFTRRVKGMRKKIH